MDRLDRTLHFIVRVALIPSGLFVLGGWQGNLIGILVVAFALVPLVMTSLTGFFWGHYLPQVVTQIVSHILAQTEVKDTG